MFKKFQLKQSVSILSIDPFNKMNLLNLDSNPPTTRNAPNRDGTHYFIKFFLKYMKRSPYQPYLATNNKMNIEKISKNNQKFKRAQAYYIK